MGPNGDGPSGPRLFSIQGIVLSNDQNGTAIVGLQVDLYLGNADTGEPIMSTLTDENGVYRFTNVSPGSYTVVVEYSTQAERAKAFSVNTPLTIDLESEVPRILLGGKPISLEEALDSLPASMPSARVTRAVSVKAGQQTMVEPIVVPQFGKVNNLFLLGADPKPGSIIPADPTITFAFDIHYAFNSTPQGYLHL